MTQRPTPRTANHQKANLQHQGITSKLEPAIIMEVADAAIEATPGDHGTDGPGTAIFNDAKKYGIVRGRPTFVRMSSLLALSAHHVLRAPARW